MAASFGSTDAQEVKLDCWLSVHPGDKANWNRRPSVRLTASEPALRRGERAINLRLSLPMALFEAPNIIASIQVGAPGAPVTIDASAVAEAVKGVIGMDVDIRVEQPGQ